MQSPTYNKKDTPSIPSLKGRSTRIFDHDYNLFSHLHCQKAPGRASGLWCTQESSMLAGSWGEDLFFSFLFFFFFFFHYGYTLGTRCFCWTWFFCNSVNRRYRSDILPGYYLVTTVLASTEKLPFSPSLLFWFHHIYFSRNIKAILLYYYIIYTHEYIHYMQGLSLSFVRLHTSRQRTLSVAYSLPEFPGSVNYEVLVCPWKIDKLK